MNNEEIIKKIEYLIEDNYPFSEKQINIWNELKHTMNNLNSINSLSALCTEVDTLLTKLGDPHTKIVSLTKPSDLFLISLEWIRDDLTFYDNGKLLKIIKINKINVNDLLIVYLNKYNLRKNFIKIKLIEDIKFNKGIFNNKHLELDYYNNNNIENKVIDLTNVDVIKYEINEKTKKYIKSYKSIMINIFDSDTIIIRILTFWDYSIMNYILDNLKLLSNKKFKNIILDLRDNNGGYINNAKDFVALFISKSITLDYDIISNKGNQDRITIVSNGENFIKNKKIFIFANQKTQSSAEFIVIKALKQYDKNITIIGQTTAGLSGQAKCFKIDDIHILQVTTKKYINTLTKKEIIDGIDPDFVIDNWNINKDVVKDNYIQWYISNKSNFTCEKECH